MLLLRVMWLTMPRVALRGEKMEPGRGLADVQAVSSHRHISLRTAESGLPGKPLYFGPFCRSEVVPYGDCNDGTTPSDRDELWSFPGSR